jgi:hypothetical protein
VADTETPATIDRDWNSTPLAVFFYHNSYNMLYNKNESQITNLQMVEIDRNRFAVEVKDGNVSVNLTKMAKPFGKYPKDWLITKEAKDYLEALSVRGNLLTADLTRVIQGGKPEEQGTWAFDYRIAMRFAQWLSPEFSIAVDELLLNLLVDNVNNSRQIPQSATLGEETVITVPMGSSINQIWVSGGVIYARLNPILRYIGLSTSPTKERIAEIGREHFLLIKTEKKPAYFVNFAGFNGLIESMTRKMSARTLYEIYHMFGVPDSDNHAGISYGFTSDEMHDILKAANRRPYNRADLLDLLLSGKREGEAL